MGPDKGPRNPFPFDLRHMTSDALTACAAFFVVSMRFERRRSRPVRRHRSVTVEAEFIGGLAQLRIVISAVYVVTGRTGYPVAIHDALHEIIPLHAVFVRRPISKVEE